MRLVNFHIVCFVLCTQPFLQPIRPTGWCLRLLNMKCNRPMSDACSTLSYVCAVSSVSIDLPISTYSQASLVSTPGDPPNCYSLSVVLANHID